MMAEDILVRAEGLCKYFKVGGGRTLHAVENVNLFIRRGETLGLVGESGCGKSTLGRTMMGIYTPTKGKLIYDGQEMNLKNRNDRFKFAKKAQSVFQDPYASLDSRMTVGSIIEEGMIIHNMYDAAKRKERVARLLDIVGLNSEHASRFPHEFSGGQRQRIGIARALAIEPEFIVCDEPISALDVSIQAQVINLLHSLQERMNLTYLFIAHDLNIVKYISDRIAVMYLGSVMELAMNCIRIRCILILRRCFRRFLFRIRSWRLRSKGRLSPGMCQVPSINLRDVRFLPGVLRCVRNVMGRFRSLRK